MHNCHVLHTIPQEKLLVHRSPEGWPRLCEYLEKDLPSVPYPHQNKNAALFNEDLMQQQLFRIIVKEMIISMSCGVVLIGVALYWCYLV